MAQKAAAVWRELNLKALQKSLDENTEEIMKMREESEQSRKELVETAKEFRKVSSEDVRKAVAPIIKRFQQEVDFLSKRCRSSETAFSMVYKKLVEAPDPTPLIEELQKSETQNHASRELVLENQKLKQTIEEYRSEFSDVKNQEVTINLLKDKIKEYEEKTADIVETKVKEKERQMIRQFAEKERELQEDKLLLVTKLGEREQEIAMLQAALEGSQTECLDLRGKFDEIQAGHHASVELLQSDLERATQRAEGYLKELELERERLSSMSQDINSSSKHSFRADETTVLNLEREIAAKDREISQLIDDHRGMQQQHNQYKATMDARLSAMETLLEEKKDEVQDLTAQLEECKDYAELKQELQVMKSIEFSASSNPHSIKDKSLEMLLMEKSRTLESENMALKHRLAEQMQRLSDFEGKSMANERLAQQQSELIQRLEETLSNVRVTGEAAEPASATLDTSAVQLSEALNNGPEAEARSAVATSSSAGGESILPIIAAQRDRFKARNAELEAENKHMQQSITNLRNEIDQIRGDNVKLYEKIRFLQSYQPKATDADPEDALKRYQGDYEDHINPFKAFSNKEKQRKYSTMNTADKVAFNLSRLVLSSQYGRMAFFLYALLLHSLIFLVLYKLSHTECSNRELAVDAASVIAQRMLDSQKAANGHTG
eukprot:m.153539 g.153539  ORF g.153539 m.153539 type:complete len:665 (+) comp16942_c0_seq1:248-2242(+)